MYPVSFSDLPIPVHGVLFILIVDIISKSALLLFSLLCAIKYHYNKGPVIVENITILTIHGVLFCIFFIQLILLQ